MLPAPVAAGAGGGKAIGLTPTGKGNPGAPEGNKFFSGGRFGKPPGADGGGADGGVINGGIWAGRPLGPVLGKELLINAPGSAGTTGGAADGTPPELFANPGEPAGAPGPASVTDGGPPALFANPDVPGGADVEAFGAPKAALLANHFVSIVLTLGSIGMDAESAAAIAFSTPARS